MSKQVKAVWIGGSAYLTKPAKYNFTLCYADGSRDVLVTAYEDGKQIAKQYGLKITPEPERRCYCDSDDSCSCESSESSSSDEPEPSKPKGAVVPKKEKTKAKQEWRKFVSDE
jgi:hypothetical protein